MPREKGCVDDKMYYISSLVCRIIEDKIRESCKYKLTDVYKEVAYLMNTKIRVVEFAISKYKNVKPAKEVRNLVPYEIRESDIYNMSLIEHVGIDTIRLWFNMYYMANDLLEEGASYDEAISYVADYYFINEWTTKLRINIVNKYVNYRDTLSE